MIDLATGTADVAIIVSEEMMKLEAASKHDAPALPGGAKTVAGKVVGIDPSAKMLEVGLLCVPRMEANA